MTQSNGGNTDIRENQQILLKGLALTSDTNAISNGGNTDIREREREIDRETERADEFYWKV